MGLPNREWLKRIPKIELHLHLEGAIPIPILWKLIQKYDDDDDDGGIRTEAELERRFVYTNFDHFIETWIWKNRFFREYEDFIFVAEAVARDLVSQNIRYVEAFISPSGFVRRGLE